MKFVVEFDCHGAAFEESRGFEVSRILRALAGSVAQELALATRDSEDPFVLFDVNGNRVGEAKAVRTTVGSVRTISKDWF